MWRGGRARLGRWRAVPPRLDRSSPGHLPAPRSRRTSLGVGRPGQTGQHRTRPQAGHHRDDRVNVNSPAKNPSASAADAVSTQAVSTAAPFAVSPSRASQASAILAAPRRAGSQPAKVPRVPSSPRASQRIVFPGGSAATGNQDHRGPTPAPGAAAMAGSTATEPVRKMDVSFSVTFTFA